MLQCDTISFVASFNSSLTRFFILSLMCHALVFLTWPRFPRQTALLKENIPVSLLPAPEPKPARPAAPQAAKPTPATKIPREAPTRPSRTPVIVAQKSSPMIEDRPSGAQENRAEKEPRREKPPPREPPQEQLASADRQLPTLKQLLPPITWSPSDRKGGSGDGPVGLNTTDPQYITYFGSIKRSIEIEWQYPELALKYGLQGKLLLQFAIRNNGELESATVVRSSGSHVLDEEAVRAVKAAAPFKPIPPWINKNRIEIVASFEYLDNRLNYRMQ
jgi:periplasmic protein TonB